MKVLLEKDKKKRTEFKKRLTVDDYLLMPDNGKSLQLIDGDFIMAPSPNLKHQEVSRNIQEQFSEFLKKDSIGKILNAPMDYYIDNYNVVQPDLIYISKKKYRILFEKGVRNTPDLLIEIISKKTESTDRDLKRDLYWRVGVKEYWIVDINEESIEVYKYKSEGYRLEKIYKKENNDKIMTELLKGLKIDLNKVFYFDWLD